MYNESGEFAIRVGIPAKSGVAGGIFGRVKGDMGIGIFGPALDANGNSIAGFKILELLSAQEGWSIFNRELSCYTSRIFISPKPHFCQLSILLQKQC